MNCLVQSRPRSSQNQPQKIQFKQPRVASAKSVKQTIQQSRNQTYLTSSSTTTLKISQFSHNSATDQGIQNPQRQSNLKEMKTNPINSSQKQFSLKLQQNNLQEINEEYFTIGHDKANFSSIIQQPGLETAQLTIRNNQKDAQEKSQTKKPDKIVNQKVDPRQVKSTSSTIVLRQSNKQQSPGPSLRQHPKELVVQSSKVLKKTVNLHKTIDQITKPDQSELTSKENQSNGPQEPYFIQDDPQIVYQAPQDRDQNIQEINVKIDSLLTKYKNCSFFNGKAEQQNQQQQQLLHQQSNLNSIQRLPQQTNISSQQQQQQINTQKQVVEPQKQTEYVSSTSNIVNKYITRVSRGKTFMGQVFGNKDKPVTSQKPQGETNDRHRMNSPLQQRNTIKKKEANPIFSSRDYGNSPSKYLQVKKKFCSAEKVQQKKALDSQKYSSVSNPLFTQPFQEFGYYMTFLQYFHQANAPFNNNQLASKVSKLYENNKETLMYFDGIYKEHFQQTYHALQFCKDICKVPLEKIKDKMVKLPTKKCIYQLYLPIQVKHTIIFDLDETLIHCNESNESPADVVLPIHFPSGEIIDAGINVRPYCREMLRVLSKQFEIIVFTASHECYASKVLDFLDPEHNLVQFRLFRESCVVVDDGLHVKDLRILNRDLKDIILVDNAAYSFSSQLENGVPIIPFYDNQQDKELIYLTSYLLSLFQNNDIPERNYSYFKTYLYNEQESPESTLAKLF